MGQKLECHMGILAIHYLGLQLGGGGGETSTRLPELE